jgi:hypothetical protein
MVTLNVYAHLFEDDLDRLYEALDARFSERQTARRPGAASEALTKRDRQV